MVKINYFFLKKYIYPTFLDNAPPLLSRQRRVACSHPARPVARYLRPMQFGFSYWPTFGWARSDQYSQNFWRFMKHFKLFQTYEKVPKILFLFHDVLFLFHDVPTTLKKSFLEHFKLFQTSQMVELFQTEQNVPKQFWNVFILVNIWKSSEQLWNAEERNNLNSLKQVRMGKNI